MPEVKNLSELITTAQSILILIKGLKSVKDLDALVMLTVFLRSQNKSYQILSLEEVPAYIKKDAKSENLDILTELKPSEYIVSINYGAAGVEKVVYDTDKAQGKLVFKITPSGQGFDFKNIEFIEGGLKFDATITVGVSDPKQYSDFFDQNEYLFKEKSYYAFNNFEDIPALFTTMTDMPSEVAQLVLDKTVKNINVIEGVLEKDVANKLLSLQAQGADMYSSIQKKYYSNDEKYQKLIQLIWSKYIQDKEKKYSYAVISKEDLIKVGLDNQFRFIGKIPFNIIKDIDVAFLFIELDEQNTFVVFESNTSSILARTAAIVFDGEGDSAHASCLLENIPLNEIDKRFLPVLKDLYNLDITIKTDSNIVDNLSKTLTKPRKNSKNKGLNK